MNEQDNLQTVRHAYKAFVEGDLPTVLSLVTDDAEFLPPIIASVPWAHPWRGRKEVEQYFRALADSSFRNSRVTNSSSAAIPSLYFATSDASRGRQGVSSRPSGCRFLIFATVSYVGIESTPIPPPGTPAFNQQNRLLSKRLS